MLKLTNSRPDLRIGALGSGSDYTPFLQHLGIASLNIGFGGEDGSGTYHSIYDSYSHYFKFSDPGFKYGIALSKVCGHSVLRLANADVLPFDFANFADTVGVYVNEVTRLADSLREDAKTANQMITSGMWRAVQDPTDKLSTPKLKSEVPNINFEPLKNALAKLKNSAAEYQKAAAGKQLSASERKTLDDILYKSERLLTRSEGLPRRDWFRHQIYAPGFYTGYGVKTLPGVREALEQRDWTEAQEQILIVSRTIEGFSAQIDRAAKVY